MTLPSTDNQKPRIYVSTESDPDDKNREDRQFELDYKAAYDKYMKQKRTFEENSVKAYAEIWVTCNKAMKSKIESRKDYEKQVYNKPIKLIESIKEHALNYEDSHYEMGTILDAFNAYINCKQRDKEILQDYTRRFKVAREVLQSHLGGVIIPPKFIKTMPGYDEDDEDKGKISQRKLMSSFQVVYIW